MFIQFLARLLQYIILFYSVYSIIIYCISTPTKNYRNNKSERFWDYNYIICSTLTCYPLSDTLLFKI